MIGGAPLCHAVKIHTCGVKPIQTVDKRRASEYNSTIKSVLSATTVSLNPALLFLKTVAVLSATPAPPRGESRRFL